MVQKVSCGCAKAADNALGKLKKITKISGDSADVEVIQKYKTYITHVTTNPTLVMKALDKNTATLTELVEKAVSQGKSKGGSPEENLQEAMDMLFILIAAEMLKIIPGTVSIELDPRLSFEKDKTASAAKRLIKLAEAQGVDKSRILVKIAATWEGIQAAKTLKGEGIGSNLTLVFSLDQAALCAEAGAEMVSPFCGRIRDFAEAKGTLDKDNDPGVVFITDTYNYMKKHGYKTNVLGASFRTIDEIKSLGGCDVITISPEFMDELIACQEEIPRSLTPENAEAYTGPKLELNEGQFRWNVNDNEMANDKLSDGIRKFAVDTIKLENFLGPQIDPDYVPK